MSTNENEKRVAAFFEKFNTLPQYYKLEKVHHLINNPDAKARHGVQSKIKPFKFIIMTSVFLISIAALFLVNQSIHENKKAVCTENAKFSAQAVVDSLTHPDLNNREREFQSEVTTLNPLYNEQKNNKVLQAKNLPVFSVALSEDRCNWPGDTLLEREKLYVFLTKKELLRLGIHTYDSALIYNNQPPCSNEVYGINLNQNFAPEKPAQSTFTFSGIYITDTNCATYRWGHPFYKEVDTLMPVFVDVPFVGRQIFWFNVNDDLFQVLPQRYQYLKSTYQQLICCKIKNPEHTFVNYVNVTNNVILDEINYLELSFEEFGKIGVDVSEGEMNIKHPTSQLWYCINKKATFQTTWGPFPPNPLPLLVTDEKGLEQCFFGWRDSIPITQSYFEVLVPVKMPLDKLFEDKNYFEIFWFYPTQDFIDSLPDRYRDELRSEYQALVKGGKVKGEGSCTFFEACKSTLVIDDFKVYPNPVQNQLNVSFSIEKETVGTISLANITGQLVQVLIPEKHFESGLNHFVCYLKGIPGGIYLLHIKTSEGFKTQRIIVSD